MQRLADSPLGLSANIYRSSCYDTTWALAYALNNTIAGETLLYCHFETLVLAVN